MATSDGSVVSPNPPTRTPTTPPVHPVKHLPLRSIGSLLTDLLRSHSITLACVLLRKYE